MPFEIIVTQTEKEEINRLRKARKAKDISENIFYQKVWDLFLHRPNDVVRKLGLPNKETVLDGGWLCYAWSDERIANAPELPSDILDKYGMRGTFFFSQKALQRKLDNPNETMTMFMSDGTPREVKRNVRNFCKLDSGKTVEYTEMNSTCAGSPFGAWDDAVYLGTGKYSYSESI